MHSLFPFNDQLRDQVDVDTRDSTTHLWRGVAEDTRVEAGGALRRWP